MPPKVKYTKEQIANSAFELVRKEGMGALTARSLASYVGTSTAPIFTAFKNIDEIKCCVKNMAVERYKNFFEKGIGEALPFKGTGMSYIRFAVEEPWLFKLLFMDYDVKDTVQGYHPGESEYSEKVLDTVRQNYGMDTENGKWLYNHLSVYTHGLAVMFANGNSMFSIEDADRMLSEAYKAFSGKGKMQ